MSPSTRESDIGGSRWAVAGVPAQGRCWRLADTGWSPCLLGGLVGEQQGATERSSFAPVSVLVQREKGGFVFTVCLGRGQNYLKVQSFHFSLPRVFCGLRVAAPSRGPRLMLLCFPGGTNRILNLSSVTWLVDPSFD